MNIRQRGFTLIELLVVIAIIGILSSVVLTSLNSARGKANNSKVKAQLAAVRSAAELYYDGNNSSYGPASTMTAGQVTASPPCLGTLFNHVSSGMESITGTATAWPSGVTLSCQVSVAEYAVSARLPVAEGPTLAITHWCVDHSGKSVGIAAHLAQGATDCP